jgi:N-carbamoyl-L-amino-acid hydrolase
VRAPTPERRDAIVAAIRVACPDAVLTTLADDPGVRFDDRVRHALAEAATDAAIPTIDLASYAGHDAGVIAAGGIPAGMLFVRSPDGISHNPAEHASESDCRAGIEVLRGALARLLRG